MAGLHLVKTIGHGLDSLRQVDFVAGAGGEDLKRHVIERVLRVERVHERLDRVLNGSQWFLRRLPEVAGQSRLPLHPLEPMGKRLEAVAIAETGRVVFEVTRTL